MGCRVSSWKLIDNLKLGVVRSFTTLLTPIPCRVGTIFKTLGACNHPNLPHFLSFTQIKVSSSSYWSLLSEESEGPKDFKSPLNIFRMVFIDVCKNFINGFFFTYWVSKKTQFLISIFTQILGFRNFLMCNWF